MKKELLKQIDKKIEEINDEDFTGVLYWSQFKDFVNDFEDKPKGKSLEERKDLFHAQIQSYHGSTFGTELVGEFYLYWTEHNEGGNKMRFEMSKNQPFNIKRRLVTWAKRSKQFNNGTTTTKTIDKLKGF